MPAQLIDGNALAKKIRSEVAERAAALTAQGRRPGLAVILVGDDPASQVYVKHKVADCETSGVRSVLEKYDAGLAEAELLARIAALNADPTIHGILVQMPLPKHIDPFKVIEAISPLKDVDGFHVQSAGALMVGRPGFKACTPYGCMKLIETTGVELRGKNAVAIGLPTVLLRPITTAVLPRKSTPVVSISFMQPYGVHALNPGRPTIRAPALCTWNPSTSFSGEIASITLNGSICFGSGICTRMPWIVGSAFSAAMRASRFASARPASYFSSTERTPLASQSATLCFT